MKEEPQYGTWIRTYKVAILWALAGVFLLVAALAIASPWFLLSLFPAFILAYIAVIVALTRWRFSARGGDFQNRIHDLMLAYKTTLGETVDIGCGNGHLIIKIAKTDKSSTHLGLDFWGSNWEYSIEQCRSNARIEGVINVEFVQGSASRNGLDTGRYAFVVSCLTFHEVRDQPNKALVVAEALRILKPGGTYVFFDLFDDRRHYPSLQDLLETIKLAGCTVTTNASLAELISLPFPLNNKNALKYARLLSGQMGHHTVEMAI